MTNTEEIADRLVSTVREYKRCIVAYSAGVDSTVVAKAAQIALGDQASAVTAVSPSLATGELDEAKAIAALIGIQHKVIATNEVASEAYQQNNHDRCYFCKTELYDHLAVIAKEFPGCLLVNGTNTDDLGDHRPGLVAAAEHGVRSPLVECDIDKQQVRALAAFWQLPVWNKPAMPCLSSRIAYGVQVTPERLRRIDSAEQFLRSQGFRELRVRLHQGEVARVEVAREELSKLLETPLRDAIVDQLESLGFQFVTLDLKGFRSGNLNAMIPLDVLQGDAARRK